MGSLSPGFHGKTFAFEGRLPPGQYPTEFVPVPSAGPTPRIPMDRWSLPLTTAVGETRTCTRDQMMALPQEEPKVDIHCVTGWPTFGTRWRGVSLDVFLDEVETAADFVGSESSGGCTGNLPPENEPGLWESAGHHEHGAPWREQRYRSD